MTTPAVRAHQTDIELVAAILQRDRKATARLVELHADAVHRYVWRRLNPKLDMVDDLVQEVFMAAWRGLRGYSGEASLQTWLVGIARHKVEDHYRRTLSVTLESLEPDEGTPAVLDPVDLDSTMDLNRQAEQAAAILATIPYDYAAALRWRYWEGRSAREMSEATGKTEKAIERLLARARGRFRDLWIAQKGER